MKRRKLPIFPLLLGNYPNVIHPCDQPFENQCAIRMSIALIKSGFKLTHYTEPLCKHGHARGAEALAVYLKKYAGMPQVYKNADQARKSLGYKTGMVFFKDLTGFRGGRGDHFDLYFWGQTKTGEYFDFCKESWFWEVW